MPDPVLDHIRNDLDVSVPGAKARGCLMRHPDRGEELFTNALEHGPAEGRVLVGYCLWRQGARLVVCDGGGPGMPRIVQAGGHDVGGRGLQVVNSLAARWGSFLLPGARVVWCDLEEHLLAEPGDAWAWLHVVLSMESLSVPDHLAAGVNPGALAAGVR